MAFNMDNSERPLTAKEKRQEQLRRWESSATDEESAVLSNLKPKVKFHDGAVFLAACSSGDLDEVQVLLDKGADINFANVDGLTALHQACIDGNLDVVEFLVEHGTDIDQQDNEGWTPLHAAASCGFMDIARYLVDNHANVAAVNSEGEVPLDIAEDDEMLEFLQQEIDNQGLDVESARNEEQETMIADAKQYLNSMHNGDMPSIYRHPKSGATALHVAAAKGYIDVIRLLLQSGMDVNLRDNDGWTPLHAASHWSQQEAAKLLADRGANFQSRSNLGQAPCDVADEDMLEYMRDLQKESRLQHKESELIKPPPSTNIIANKPRTEVRQEVVVTEKFNSIRNNGGMDDVSRISAAEKAFNRDTMINSSSDSEDEDSTSSSEAPVKSSKPPLETRMEYTRSEIRRTGSSENVRVEETTTITHSESGGNVRAGFAGRRTTRPASLHISSTATNKDVRPPIMSAQELSSTRPVAATQPVQSVKSNGPDGTPVTPTERNSDIKEGAPATWRLGLRKTGSFDDKMRMGRPPPGSTGTPGRPDGSNAGGKTQEEFKTSKTDSATRTARVTPIIDARVPAKNRTTNKEEENTSGFQRTGSYRAYSNDSALSSTNAPISYKRSVEETPDVGSKETVTNMLNAIDARPDRRRSHLQPVRDEEAEAQRKARSRRERQTRRSTQGVTLDVFEEAKRTIDNMKQERSENASASKQAEDSTASNDTGRIPHNDSLSTAHRRFNAGGPHSNPRNVTLPSGYIPSNERVQNKAKQPPISTVVPSINIENNDEKQDEEKQDTEDGGDEGNSLTPGGQSPSARKSAAQQRRRQRKERRSTGLPGLKPSSTADVSDRVRDNTTPVEMGLAPSMVGGPSSSPRIRPKFAWRHRVGKSAETSEQSVVVSKVEKKDTNDDDDVAYRALVDRLSRRVKRVTRDETTTLSKPPLGGTIGTGHRQQNYEKPPLDGCKDFPDESNRENKPQSGDNESSDESEKDHGQRRIKYGESPVSTKQLMDVDELTGAIGTITKPPLGADEDTSEESDTLINPPVGGDKEPSNPTEPQDIKPPLDSIKDTSELAENVSTNQPLDVDKATYRMKESETPPQRDDIETSSEPSLVSMFAKPADTVDTCSEGDSLIHVEPLTQSEAKCEAIDNQPTIRHRSPKKPFKPDEELPLRGSPDTGEVPDHPESECGILGLLGLTCCVGCSYVAYQWWKSWSE